MRTKVMIGAGSLLLVALVGFFALRGRAGSQNQPTREPVAQEVAQEAAPNNVQEVFGDQSSVTPEVQVSVFENTSNWGCYSTATSIDPSIFVWAPANSVLKGNYNVVCYVAEVDGSIRGGWYNTQRGWFIEGNVVGLKPNGDVRDYYLTDGTLNTTASQTITAATWASAPLPR